MADDNNRHAGSSGEDCADAAAAGRKRLGENGLPQEPLKPEQQDAANRTKMTVTRKPEPSPHALGRKADRK